MVIIYHNPACGTSRNTLAMIRRSGVEPQAILYLETPPLRERLEALIAAMGIAPRNLLHRRGTPDGDLGLDNPDLTDVDLIDAMMAHPTAHRGGLEGNAPVPPLRRSWEGSRQPKDRVFYLGRRRGGATVTPVPDLPNIDADYLHAIDPAVYAALGDDGHAPRILILYGSLRERSFSRFAAEEAARVLRWFGAKTCVFDPTGLPLPDGAPEDHPNVAKLRNLATSSDGMVWSSPERHGAMTGVMKSQIDWIPLFLGAV